MGPASKSTATFSPYPANLGLSSVRETSMPSIEEANLSKGGGVVGIAEPDLYDPDQPLWNKEQPTDDRIKKPPSSRKGTGDDEMENMGRNADEGTSTGSQGLPSVWNRIGHVDRSDTNSESILRPNPSVYRSRVSRREFLEARETTIATGKSNISDERDEKTTLMTDVNTVPEGQQRPSEKIGFNPRGKWNKEQGSERAQRTLYIGGIPSNVNKKELLKAHFQKFGEIMDIRIPSSQGDRAFVQFLLPENAESALKSPEAVMGNRFIRLSWAKRDSIPIPLVEEGNGISTSATWNLKGVALESVMKGKKQLGISTSTPEENTLKGISKVAISNPQPSPPNPQSTPSSISQKKQEELEHMKEELRKKQEDLAQKRDEFRRKLERLSKQVNINYNLSFKKQFC
jgi:RNA-binding protein 26